MPQANGLSMSSVQRRKICFWTLAYHTCHYQKRRSLFRAERFTSRTYGALRGVLVGRWRASPANDPPKHPQKPACGPVGGRKTTLKSSCVSGDEHLFFVRSLKTPWLTLL